MSSAPRARVFLALACGRRLGEALLGHAVEALGGAGEAGRAYRLPRAEGLHLTLLFLGDVERERLAPLWDAVAVRTRDDAAPRLTVDRAGCFPDCGRPRVLWLGVGEAGREDLARLRAACLDAAREQGFEVAAEGARAFRPHLTVARPRTRRAAPAAFRELAPGVAWVAERLSLIESVRAEAGSNHYREVAGLDLDAG